MMTRILIVWVFSFSALLLTAPDPARAGDDAESLAVYRTALLLYYGFDGRKSEDALRANARSRLAAEKIVPLLDQDLQKFAPDAFELRNLVVSHLEGAGTCKALARGLDHWFGDGELGLDKSIGRLFLIWADVYSLVQSPGYSAVDEWFFYQLLLSELNEEIENPREGQDFALRMILASATLGSPYASKFLADRAADAGDYKEALEFYFQASYGKDIDVSAEIARTRKQVDGPIDEPRDDYLPTASGIYLEKSCFGPTGRFHVTAD